METLLGKSWRLKAAKWGKIHLRKPYKLEHLRRILIYIFFSILEFPQACVEWADFMVVVLLKLQLCDNERTHYALVYLYIMLIANESVTIASN